VNTHLGQLSLELKPIHIGQDVIGDNPGLKPRIAEASERAYRKARIEAARETGLEESQFPDACPYGWDDLVARDISL
jgi:hypothetical protein